MQIQIQYGMFNKLEFANFYTPPEVVVYRNIRLYVHPSVQLPTPLDSQQTL